ncbi:MULTISPECIES: UDP-3-O-(3-hydroxymyristoyl)glucosamine N-acyltransferase [Altibacter]|uniref:UDP-3-O-(3-hydroxymyristoyl)glucosamine N-acyltransferase n=1 Tax=Altibacter TaxID=1535231 RepID=UPI000553A047|nr:MULTISPECIES: UDP-3-O-(3-hydroxymyristoyl)glucosamine N-acyltransferase [Altibacter]MCW8980992.1 UDP-3-O-(3-hydroxymyristoyl)glucosamine N-acyltransferase [Altibacter sp.]MCW9037789.1 UDP-3-O-(3-hydroxymyristoyl)glucosamine N-acyltransferase [Altibacter sp.]
MKFAHPQTLEEIAAIISADYVGPADFPVLGMNEIHVVRPGDIVFVDHPKYYEKALNSQATIILINKEVECPPRKALLISDDPFRDFNTLTNYFRPFKPATAVIAPSASIGKNTVVQPNTFIGNNVVIGDNCTIHSNVCIYDHTIIGNNVTIHSGTVLGADAFYYKNRPEKFDKLISGGNVVIMNNVDIGALCTIDKGVSASTIIGEGTKLDNQVHVGHDTVIGSRCLIASQVGIAGCVLIEDFVTIWGQVGITSGITIGEKAVISAQSGVSKSLPGHKSYFGTPADEFRKKYKELASIRLIPDIIDKLDKIQ